MLAVDLHQISQSQLFQIFITHTIEEEGVVRPGVGSQEDANGLVCWETVAGVVDESRGPVSDALSSSDVVPLPELLTEGEDDFSGAVVVNCPQCLHLFDGEGGGEQSQ